MAIPKIIKAGSGERAQYLMHGFNDNTIRFILNYPALLDVDTTRLTIKTLVESVDVLHGTFFTDGASAYWKLNEEVDESNYFLYVETEGDPLAVAKSLSLIPVYSEDKVQIHCTLVQNEKESSLVLRISHLVVDGGDGKYLLEKFCECYNRIAQSGTTEGFEIKNGSRAPEQAFEELSREDMKKLNTPISSTDVRSCFPFPTQEPGRNRMLTAVVSKDIMTAARKKAKMVNASANDILMTAAYHAYGKLTGIDPEQPMSMNAMMNLRRHCDDGESDGLCNISGSFVTVLEKGASGTFLESLEEISRQSNAVKEDPLAGLAGIPSTYKMVKKMPVWLMLKFMGRLAGNSPIGVTNLGNMNCDVLTLGGITPCGGLFGGPLKKKPGMQVGVMSFDGRCALSVVTQCTDEDAALIREMLDAMVSTIESFAE